MVPVDGSFLRFVFATDEASGELEALQELLQQGPCQDSRAQGQVVNLADLAVEGAWPQYQASAAAVGIQAVTSVPLIARGQTWGVLDVYRHRAERLDPEELAAARTLANLATSYLLVTADRDAARLAQEQLAHHAMHDPLTGVPVRWVFLEQLALALVRLQRSSGQVAVLFVDLDGLKYVNDTYGHWAGDRLLTTCVQRLREAVRPSDIVARIGGDEFAILTAHSAEEVRELTASLARALDREGLHTSFGWAAAPDDGAVPVELFRKADDRLYAAKLLRRNQQSTLRVAAQERVVG
jgi:diguanylate cyclase (GGDEF)-like protein